MIAEMERRIQELLQKVLKESEKGDLTIKCTKTEYTVINKRNTTTNWTDQNEAIKIITWEVFQQSSEYVTVNSEGALEQ